MLTLFYIFIVFLIIQREWRLRHREVNTFTLFRLDVKRVLTVGTVSHDNWENVKYYMFTDATVNVTFVAIGTCGFEIIMKISNLLTGSIFRTIIGPFYYAQITFPRIKSATFLYLTFAIRAMSRHCYVREKRMPKRC